MKAKKLITLVLCAVLLIVASIAGTVAYFTDQDTVVNTFTVGDVDIELYETNLNAGPSDDANITYKGNTYHLLPGQTYVKDPTVTVLEGSEECYVRTVVTAAFDKELTDTELATELDSVFQGYNAAEWPRQNKTVEIVNGKTVITYEFRYADPVPKSANNTTLTPLFKSIVIPGSWTNDQISAMQNLTVTVEAHAIQAAGFSDADAAWIAFGVQHP